MFVFAIKEREMENVVVPDKRRGPKCKVVSTYLKSWDANLYNFQVLDDNLPNDPQVPSVELKLRERYPHTEKCISRDDKGSIDHV